MTFQARGRTKIEVAKDDFILDHRPTYEGSLGLPGITLAGLLLNSRMANAIFDDLNEATRSRWAYPDTGSWDPERNTAECLAAMPTWRDAGLLAITVGVQGGNPAQYTLAQPWRNPGFARDGALLPAYKRRLSSVLDRADELGLVIILNPFYFGQDRWLANDAAVRRALDDLCVWMLELGWQNVVLDLVNECDLARYSHGLLTAPEVHDLIAQAREIKVRGRRLLVGTSFAGGSIPTSNVLECSDIVYLHGNEVEDPRTIESMVETVRSASAYRGQPVVFNEDDHFDFKKGSNNMRAALRVHASWGFFDPGLNDYKNGYQSVPICWDINTDRKKEFFCTLRDLTRSGESLHARGQDRG